MRLAHALAVFTYQKVYAGGVMVMVAADVRIQTFNAVNKAVL